MTEIHIHIVLGYKFAKAGTPFCRFCPYNICSIVLGTTWLQVCGNYAMVPLRLAPERNLLMMGSFFGLTTKGGIEQIKNLAPPRLFETHSNATFFHRQLGGSSPCLKFIHIMRNPLRDLFRFYQKGQIRFSDILTIW